ncbi:thioesterase II family protein [Actinomadura rupiterrae]|uniref:thioesterase II family protein n=1 Tax=Actinomadura rupiterrae TaxID=559627 RepID=UPI0020A29147|nr:alpha/beta fold hydrolase [Actinomadura rupiterrae]MCP2342747.1 surfactin synthase thioesterase subunit [Actinomadura rupiterrae]
MTETIAIGRGSESDTWIRRFHPAPDAALRLVCFPHAGGSASFYFPVSNALRRSASLAGRVEVLAVQYPGRQDRRTDPPITDLNELADHVARALAPHADRPLMFFGHSMGASIAFETARRLEAKGSAPVAVVASGRRAPSRHRAESVHRRDDAGVIAELRALSGTDPSLLEDEELLRLFLPAVRADYTAIETYRAEPDATVSCPITVFTGDADPHVTLDEAEAWRGHTTGAFELRVFEGGHFYLSTSPALTIERLSEILQRHVR